MKKTHPQWVSQSHRRCHRRKSTKKKCWRLRESTKRCKRRCEERAKDKKENLNKSFRSEGKKRRSTEGEKPIAVERRLVV